ncbi:hypothetical protein [Terricaulis silvestris]|jgi:hypothetical protein|uniref:Uncharacterized protein n=1 Tax=Terricaulis silvestris TaxID=2686094 RepID=A0A6I6MT01_9CAUL|nr:hypothetical protein [Terricaulis silvestris]QGZ96566.1 hypothetical protein DSM104635_03426 [Terricaulis silvestris]
MSDKPADYGREVRDTIVKSSLTGVAATVLAVTIFSPAGFGGLIGTSLASGFGLDPNANAADDPYASLPAFPSPLSPTELETIRSQLARTTASLEITRAATEERIEHIRSIALTDRGATFAPAPQVVEAPVLRLSTAEPVETAPVEAYITTASYAASPMATPDRDLELAELLLAHQSN